MIDVELSRIFVDAALFVVIGLLTLVGRTMRRRMKDINTAVIPVKEIEHVQKEVLGAVKQVARSTQRLEERLGAYEEKNERRHDAAERRLDELQSQVAVLVDRRRQDDENMRRYKGPRRRKGE